MLDPVWIGALAILLGGAGAAHADAPVVCVEIDASLDTLAEGDRNGARALLLSTFETEGRRVSSAGTGCGETYRVHHIALGSSITVTVRGPGGTRQVSAHGLSELPRVYSQLVRALLAGVPVGTSSAAITRENVTVNQAAPLRVEADSLWYGRIGYGAAVGAGFTGGPSLGLGWRYEIDDFGVDISALNLLLVKTGDAQGVSGTWLRVAGLYFLEPIANQTVYLGAGVGLGGTMLDFGSKQYNDWGLHTDAIVGFEFLRASTIRLFTQLDVSLPVYIANGSDTDTFLATTGEPRSLPGRWVPSIQLTFGAAFGGGNRAIRFIGP